MTPTLVIIMYATEQTAPGHAAILALVFGASAASSGRAPIQSRTDDGLIGRR